MICIAIPAVFSPLDASAQSWTFEPIIRLGVEYDDNATLNIRTDQETELTGWLADLRARLEYTSSTNMLLIEPRATVRNYGDDSQFDSDDYFLRSLYTHDWQSSSFSFRANYDRQTVRTAERAVSDIEVDDPDEITDDDTGRIILEGTRNKWRLSPGWSYRVSNISAFSADLDYFDVQYEDEVSGLLSDYTDARLSLNYGRGFSNVSTALLTVTGRRFDTTARSRDITGYGVLAGLEHDFSEQVTVTAMIGLEDTDQSGFDSDPEVVGHVTLRRNLDTIRMFARYRRAIVASGGGRLTIRDAFNLNFRRRMNERITAGLGIRAYHSEGIGADVSIDDRNYIQLQSTFRWFVSTSTVIEASYRYTISDRSASLGERANSNQINLWLVYQPRTVPRL